MPFTALSRSHFAARRLPIGVWLVVPMNRTGSGQLNGELLTPGNLLAFGGSVEVAGASGAPLRCGMLSIAPSALERTATPLGIKSRAPGEGEFRVVSVVDRGRLSRALDLLSHIVSRHEDAALAKTRKDRSYLRGLRQEMAVPGPDTRRPLRSVRRVGAASPLRLLSVLPDVAHRLPACRRAQRGTARTRRRTPPARCRQPCRDGLGLLASQSLRCLAPVRECEPALRGPTTPCGAGPWGRAVTRAPTTGFGRRVSAGLLRLLSRRSPPRPPARRAPPSRRPAARWPSSSRSRPAGPGRSSPWRGRTCRA